MPKQLSSRPLLLPSPSNAIPCDFNRVWLRMTARECLNVCSAYNLITSSPVIGDEPEQMPSDLSAEGALAWMSWNQGRGNYYFGALDPLAPKRITNANALTLWLDGQDRATLLDGSDIPVNDGEEVATRFFKMPADKSGAGHDLAQANSDYRPNWYADGYVSFPGGVSTVQLKSGREACSPRPTGCPASARRRGLTRQRRSLAIDNLFVDGRDERAAIPCKARGQTAPRSTARAQ